jgi:adenylate kinase family enzyme
MKKIVIIGSPGAGKSFFARQLGEILNIEAIHLDRYFWQPKWKEKPEELRRQIMQKLVAKDQWIIEGSYLDTSYIRLRAADTIIFLDIPNWLCLWRVINRYFKYHRESRPDLPEGCPEKLRLHYLLKILSFPFFKRKELYRWLIKFEHEKRVYTFHSNRDIERFLHGVGQTQEEQVPENTLVLKDNYAPVSVSLS